MFKKKYMKYIIALVLYCVLVFMANWSLITGVNLMKWDIWDAQYPNQMITADALSSGQYPLWNPLFNYGTPNYAQVGTPIWYVVSFLLNIIGYGPAFPGIEYSLHLVIAAMGMFCLAFDSVKDNMTLSDYVRFAVSFCAGALYAFSGLFLSNAEHIMIIISAAWIPFVLLFTKKIVCSSYKIFYTMLSGLIAGFVLSGGYPEQFFDMFIVVFFWMLVISALNQKDTLFKKVRNALIQYVSFGMCTAFSVAITLIPFLKLKNQITRGEGQALVTYSFESILSTIFPVSFDQISGTEISMGLFYIGIITIISFPLIFKYGKKNYIYIGAAVVALFLAFGSNSFLYGLFYRFVPMYSTFRFPTVWRVYWALFSILAVTDVWGNMLERTEEINRFKNVVKIVFCGALVVSILIWVEKITTDSENVKSVLNTMGNASFFLIGIMFVYFCSSYVISNKVFSKNVNTIIFTVLICAEVLSIAQRAMPVMIARREANSYYYDAGYAAEVNNEFALYNNRNTSCDFSDSARTTSGAQSIAIGANKTIDEGGYVSILLADIQNYKGTYNRSITQKNPVVFFTNDIVSSDEIALDKWSNMPEVSPYQIHMNKKDAPEKSAGDNLTKASDNEILSEQNIVLNYSEDMKLCFVEGQFAAKRDTVTRMRVYVNTDKDDVVIESTYSNAADGNENYYSGTYKISTDDNGDKFVDMSLPRVDETYSKISYVTESDIDKISVIEFARNAKDKYAEVNKFGFNDIQTSVQAPTDGMIVVMQSYYDGWKAYVDGKKVDIKKVDGCFIGVPVEEGSHTIELQFEPWDFKLGALLSLIYVLVFIGVFIYTIRKVRMEK